MDSLPSSALTPEALEQFLLEPLRYTCHVPGKNIITALSQAFNYWLQIPQDKLKLIWDAMHMLHNIITIMDDIEDNSKLQQGVPVAQSIFGVAQTVNSASSAYFVVLSKLIQLNNAEVTKIFTEHLLEFHYWQGLGIHLRNAVLCPSEDSYKMMVTQKTGIQFRLGVQLMQLFSENKRDFKPLLDIFGLYFQIRDDYANVISVEIEGTESYCEDLTEGKFSFPIIHAVQADLHDSTLFDALRNRTTDSDVKKKCVDHMKKVGSFVYTVSVLKDLEKQALELIESYGGNPNLASLLKELSEIYMQPHLLPSVDPAGGHTAGQGQPGQGCTTDDMVRLCGQGPDGWIMSSHMTRILNKINSCQDHTLSFCLNTTTDYDIRCIMQAKDTNKVKHLVFIINVGKSPDNSVFLGSNMRPGNHWVLVTVDLVNHAVLYCDTMGWNVPPGLIHQLARFTKHFGISVLNKCVLTLAHEETPPGSNHHCSPKCQNYPLQTCSCVGGIFSLVCAIIATVKKELFKFLTGPRSTQRICLHYPTRFGSFFRRIIISWLMTGILDVAGLCAICPDLQQQNIITTDKALQNDDKALQNDHSYASFMSNVGQKSKVSSGLKRKATHSITQSQGEVLKQNVTIEDTAYRQDVSTNAQEYTAQQQRGTVHKQGGVSDGQSRTLHTQNDTTQEEVTTQLEEDKRHAEDDSTERHGNTSHKQGTEHKKRNLTHKSNAVAPVRSRTCPFCQKVLSNRQALHMHKKRIHKAALSMTASLQTVSCTLCKTFKCSTIPHLIEHYRGAHQKDMQIQRRTFDKEQDFEQWKKKIEEESLSCYVKITGEKTTKDFTKYHYYCHRSGMPRDVTDQNRALKYQRSKKIANKCTAYMTVRKSSHQGTQTVHVEYCLHHMGHKSNEQGGTIPTDCGTVDTRYETAADGGIEDTGYEIGADGGIGYEISAVIDVADTVYEIGGDCGTADTEYGTTYADTQYGTTYADTQYESTHADTEYGTTYADTEYGTTYADTEHGTAYADSCAADTGSSSCPEGCMADMKKGTRHTQKGDTPKQDGTTQKGETPKQDGTACRRRGLKQGSTTQKQGCTTNKQRAVKQGRTTNERGGTAHKQGELTQHEGGATHKQGFRKQRSTTHKQGPTKQGGATNKQRGATNKRGATTHKRGGATNKQRVTTNKQRGTTNKQRGTTHKRGGTTHKRGGITQKQVAPTCKGRAMKQRHTVHKRGGRMQNQEGTTREQGGTSHKQGGAKHGGIIRKQRGTTQKQVDITGATQKSHPQAPVRSRMCPLCQKTLSNRQALYMHRRRIHKAELSRTESLKPASCQCTLCETYKCSTIPYLIAHYHNVHQKDIKIQNRTFDKEEEFEQWKKQIEGESSSYYVKDSGEKTTKDFTKCHYYCHRSGMPRDVTDQNWALKHQRSSKIANKCTAYMTVRKSLCDRAGTVRVEYCLEHIGHSLEAECSTTDAGEDATDTEGGSTDSEDDSTQIERHNTKT